MTVDNSYSGGLVWDLARSLAAGQPGVRYGGVRAHPATVRGAAPGRLERLLNRRAQQIACRHAMAHAGGAA